MKKIAIVVLMLCVATSMQAQNWQEWFEQKKIQIQYLVDQIGALQGYENSLEKGYDIAHNGLTAIHNIKSGDFGLHSEYISSLSRVNPQIKSYWKIADMIQAKINIVKSCKGQDKLMKGSGLFTSEEIAYYSSVATSLLDACSDLVDQLIDLITDGKLDLKDDERLGRIDQLHAAMKEREKFVRSFLSETKILALQRAREQNQINVLKGIFNGEK